MCKFTLNSFLIIGIFLSQTRSQNRLSNDIQYLGKNWNTRKKLKTFLSQNQGKIKGENNLLFCNH